MTTVYVDARTFTVSQKQTLHSIALKFDKAAKINRSFVNAEKFVKAHFAGSYVRSYIKNTLGVAHFVSDECPLVSIFREFGQDLAKANQDCLTKAVTDYFANLLSKSLQNDIENPVSEIDFKRVQSSFASYDARFTHSKRQSLLNSMHVFSENQTYTICLLVGYGETFDIADFDLFEPYYKNVSHLCLYKTSSKTLATDYLFENLKILIVIEHPMQGVWRIIATNLLQQNCLIERLFIRFCDADYTTLAILAHSLQKNASLKRLQVEILRNLGWHHVREDYFEWGLLSNDTLTDLIIYEGLDNKSQNLSFKNSTAIATFNAHVKSKEFFERCLIFFALDVPPYVLLEVYRYLFPILRFKVNKEVDQKLHRFVIPKILSVYRSCYKLKFGVMHE